MCYCNATIVTPYAKYFVLLSVKIKLQNVALYFLKRAVLPPPFSFKIPIPFYPNGTSVFKCQPGYLQQSEKNLGGGKFEKGQNLTFCMS